MDSVYLLYAVLCGGSFYVALLCLFGRRVSGQRTAQALGYLGLTFAFAFLALGRSHVFGIVHGQLATFTRMAFALYGVSLAAIVGRYWLAAWRARQR
jgi:hypothetical protein